MSKETGSVSKPQE